MTFAGICSASDRIGSDRIGDNIPEHTLKAGQWNRIFSATGRRTHTRVPYSPETSSTTTWINFFV